MEYLNEEEKDEEIKDGWQAYDEDSAEWVLQKLAGLEKERDRIEYQYQKMVQRQTRWRDTKIAEIEWNEKRLQEKLQPWVKKQLEGSRRKSVDLPSGRTGVKSNEFWNINGVKVDANNSELLAFVKEGFKDFVKTTETVNWGDFKKGLKVLEDGKVMVKETGEIVPDMKVDRSQEFYVSLKGE